MNKILKKEIQKLNDDNEYLVMNCGAFSPRLLEKIKKDKAAFDKGKRKNKI